MRRSSSIASLLLVGLMLTIGAERALDEALGVEPQEGAGAAARFQAVELFVDSGAQPLAAYQLEFKAVAGDVRIVGIEGGEHAAFAAAPYYDPAAMQHERVIIAAFSTRGTDALPKGKTRVATIHVIVGSTDEPRFTATLSASATAGGAAIDCNISLQTGPNS